MSSPATQHQDRGDQSTRRSRRAWHPLRGTGAGSPRSLRDATDADISPVWEESAPLHAVPDPGLANPLFHSRDALFRRLLAFADVLGAYAALILAALVRGQVSLRPEIILIAPFIVLASKTIGLYDRDQHTLRKTTVDELPSILYVSVLFALATWFAESLLLNGWLGRPEVLSLGLGSFVFITLGRVTARRIALTATPPERCMVLGNAADASRTVTKLTDSPGVNAELVGRVSLRPNDQTEVPGVDSLGDVNRLNRLVVENGVERVIIAPDAHDQEETLHIIRMLKALGVKVSVLPRLLEVVGSSSTFDEVDGITLLGVRQYGLPKSSGFLKRAMDVVGAALGVLILSPFLLAIAIAIKVDTRGPVFFRQPRIGRKGRRFEMLKFRSMVNDAERVKDDLRQLNEADGGLFKITDDPRITRVGHFLRKTSLDELPQLFNVISGDMSLVGPRPLVPDEDALIEGWERRRLAVRPGMTGLWQIFGSSRIPMQEMVKIDYLYGANWSIWLDLKILLRTVPYVLRRRGM
jgi:exopolysaccharide biosynthesis polyprenyl glycosylphosphotransferase